MLLETRPGRCASSTLELAQVKGTLVEVRRMKGAIT